MACGSEDENVTAKGKGTGGGGASKVEGGDVERGLGKTKDSKNNGGMKKICKKLPPSRRLQSSTSKRKKAD